MAAGVFLAGVGYVLVWWLPGYLAPDGTPSVRNAIRQTWAQVLLGVVVALTFFATWKRATAAERTAEAARGQLQVSQDQQVNERFSRAVEQLGSDNMAIRLGGIYALERIAWDSARDHWQVMEVLTAYVREERPWWGERDENGVPVSDDSDGHAVPTDIQAILTVLARRNVENETEGQRLVLALTDLQWAYLGDVHLPNVIFIRANLRSAFLGGAYLQGSLLSGSNVQRARLSGANLQGADLGRANLRGADLEDANLQGVYLEGTNLEEANLEEANLGGADLSSARGLTQEQIDSAVINESTLLPDYLERPE